MNNEHTHARLTAEADLCSLIVSHLAERLRIDPQSVDVREQFSPYGLDSRGATGLIADLAQALGRPLSPLLVWRHPTSEALARHLAGGASEREASAHDGPRAQDEPIAIVGMACRFPNAPGLEDFWRLLRDGVSAITEAPRDRWDSDALFDPDLAAPGKMNTRWGGFIERIDGFDSTFFGISPREAIGMDPQPRLVLDLSWEALEDAGIVPERLKGSQTGVFFGTIWDDYAALLYQQGAQSITHHTSTGHHRSIIANRVSYALGLHGPSMTIDSACSSALVAVHLACESLRRGESTLTIAGGVNLNIIPEGMIEVSKFGGLSPEGRCFTFDARANGYVLSLEDAMRSICAYGRIIRRLRGKGVMGVVGLSWEDAAEELAGHDGRLFRAIQHSAESTVLAGEPDALDAVFQQLQRRNVFCRRVSMDVAPHGPQVDGLREDLFETLREARPRNATIPIVSEVTGSVLAGERFDAAHWVRNSRDPALFSTAIDYLLREGFGIFVELSPHPLVLPAIESNLRCSGLHGVTLRSLRRDEDERGVMLDTLGALHGLGAPVRWEALYSAGGHGRDADVSSLGIRDVTEHVTPEEAPTEQTARTEMPATSPLLVSGKTEAALRAQAERLREHLDAHPDLVAARARLMQALPQGGAMVSPQASEAEVEPWIVGREGRVDELDWKAFFAPFGAARRRPARRGPLARRSRAASRAIRSSPGVARRPAIASDGQKALKC